MNQQMQDFARNEIINGLSQCTDKQQLLFKRMYSPKDLNASIKDIIEKISPDKLDWAMEQVRKTIEKRSSNDPT